MALKTTRERPPRWSVGWSPDGSRVVSGADDGSVRVWDVGSGHELACLRGHDGGVMSVGWSPDGARVVSAGEDMTLWVWDTGSGRELARLSTGSQVRDVTWRGDLIAMACGERVVVVRYLDRRP